MSGPKVVVLGFMGACPIAGVIWQHLHYLESLRRLGCEVWYVEDTARYPYNPTNFDISEDYGYATSTIAGICERLGIPGQWSYVARHIEPAESAGLSIPATHALLREADAVLNVCGSHDMTAEIAASRRLIYVESDPGVEQIKIAQGLQPTIDFLRAHHYHFTFGEWVPTDRFIVPTPEFDWLPTRQPVVVDFWQADRPAPRDYFTTIANWSTSGQKDIEWEGERYLWSKSLEFLKYRAVPGEAGVPVEMATDIKPEETAESFREDGWRLVLPHDLSVGTDPYRHYIQSSRGEFTVAKDQYVRLKTGWFSDRSACYLAAGRPVITQETGFSEVFGHPEGGLIGFSSLEEAVEGLRRVQADYAKHSRLAEEVAREWFEGEKVLKALLKRAGVDLNG